MAFRRTSARGKVFESSTKPLQAFLYDFDIEGFEPKAGHEEWLQRMVVQPARILGGSVTGRWHVFLYGNASSTGSDRFNLNLSRKRCRAVAQFLKTEMKSLPVDFYDIPVGEEKAREAGWGDGVELEFFRSVTVIVGFFASPPPVPPPPPPPRSDPKTATFLFCLRNAKVFWSRIHPFLRFEAEVQVIDLRTKDEARYSLTSQLDIQASGVIPGTVFPVLRSFDILMPGMPLVISTPPGQRVDRFGGSVTVERFRVYPASRIPGTINLALTTTANRRYVLRPLGTGPAVNITGVIAPDADAINLEQSSSTLVNKGELKLRTGN